MIAVFDAGEQDGVPYLVTELLRGESLRARLSRPLAADEVRAWAIQLARGLSAIHAAGLIHRDLKPENLFLVDGELLKVLDFGIAKVMTPAAGEAVDGQPANALLLASTDTSRIVGTVAYMAPEQVTGQPIDARADIFAFGVVLHELLAGTLPFTGATRIEVGYGILRLPPAPLPPEAPADLAGLVGRCLDKVPGQRPANMRAILTALGGESNPAIATIAAAPQGRSQKKRIRSLQAAVAVVLLALAGFGWRQCTGRPWSSSVRIAVLPFAIRGQGSDKLADYREGLVEMLTADLSRVKVKTVGSGLTVQRSKAAGAEIDLREAAEIARSLKADLFAFGNVFVSGEQLSIQVWLYETAHPTDPQLAQARGTLPEVLYLIDEVAWKLRKLLVGPDAAGVKPSIGQMGELARKMPRSPEALQAYFEGEAALRRWDWDTAGARFERALELDKEFALAAYRLAVTVAMHWRGDEALRKAQALRSKLSEHEAKLLDAFASFRQGDLLAATRQYRRILDESPDDVEAWYQLGELQFHLNPVHDLPAEAAAEALHQVQMLDPAHGGALMHLIDLAQLKDDRPRVVGYVNRYLELGPTNTAAIPLRWTKAWAQHDTATREQLLTQLQNGPALVKQIMLTLERAVWQHDDLEDALALARVLSETGTAADRGEGFQRLGTLLYAKGRRAEAKKAFAQASEMEPARAHPYLLPFFDSLGWFPLTDEGRADFLRAATGLASAGDRPNGALPDFERLFGAYLLGTLAVITGDFGDAERRADQLARLPSIGYPGLPRDLSLAVRARLAARRDQPRVALELLRQQQPAAPYRWANSLYRVPEQLLRAEQHRQLGELDEARRWFEKRLFYGQLEPVFSTIALERTAAILEQQPVHRSEAIDRYQLWLQRLAGSDAELAPQVKAVQARLDSLLRLAQLGDH